jgi:HlyD family secretion protein
MAEKPAAKGWIWALVPVVLLSSTLISLPGDGFAAESAEMKGVPVRVVRAEKRDFSVKLSAMGTISFVAKAEVSSEVDGILAEVKADEGDLVKQGQVVAMIDSSQWEAQLARAKADVEMAEIDLAKNENEVKKAATKADAAKFTMDKSHVIFQRYKELLDRGVSCQTEMDKAEISYEKAAADYKMAMEDYAALQTKSRQGRIEAEAQVQKARAEADTIRLRLQQCTIRAPISGVVFQKKKWPGEQVRPNDSAILTILKIDEVFADVDLNEKDLAAVRPGQKAEIRADAYPEIRFEGEVTTISPVLDPNSRTVRARVKLKNDQRLLRPGMFIRAEIILKDIKDVVVVPKTAIVTTADGRHRAFVVFQGVAFLRDLATGNEKDEWVVVRKGIKEGEAVVVEGQDKLRDLAPVQARELKRP